MSGQAPPAPQPPPPSYFQFFETDETEKRYSGSGNASYSGVDSNQTGFDPNKGYTASGQSLHTGERGQPASGFNRHEQQSHIGHPSGLQYSGRPTYQNQPPPPHATVIIVQDRYGPSSGDEGGGFTYAEKFSTQDVRRAFIRKVFLILAVQLSVTFGIVCCFSFIDDVGIFIRENPAIYYASYAVFLVTYISLVCCGSVRRKHPLNLVILIIFTLAFSYMVGAQAANYDTKAVVTALGITVVVCTVVTIFSCQTKFDFSRCLGMMLVLTVVFFIFMIVSIFTYSQPWYFDVIYGSVGALLFTMFLAYDTQLIMGGKRDEIDPEEHIFGALLLYIDIVHIFLFILQIINGIKNAE